jgi:hypothetical protein
MITVFLRSPSYHFPEFSRRKRRLSQEFLPKIDGIIVLGINNNYYSIFLAAYFISLSQFSVNLSGKRKHDHIYDTILWSNAKIRERFLIIIDFLFGTEIWGILAQMATEDGLLLGLRILVVIKFDASTLENLFFVVKNILTIAIFTYYAAAISDSYIRHRYRYQHYVSTNESTKISNKD